MSAPGPAPFIQTQPRLSRFTLRGFLSLPRRLCSPPAAVGKVRSFGLTPIFDVRLEDVLDRKHLPPLSLKDFEEWLLYVEQSVENLYFVLWLREYTAKYDRWIAKVRAREAKHKHVHGHGHVRAHGHGHGHGHAPAMYRVAWSTTTPTSPSLALFFSRARETFLVPGAPYELSLPPALLDALAVVSGHPDPAVLAPARAHVEDALRASLARCVRAAYSNVGAYRAACGIAAGIFILLVGTVPPLAVNFVRAQNRWERLVILPGLWLGLTVLLASLRGICMMIYIFGDFRQLRKFELVRRPPPPTSACSTVSFESSLRTPTTLAAPQRPVRALTAPPKIAVRIPSRTPTLSYGTTTSVTVSTSTDASFSRTQDTQTGTTTNITSHTHTISISSLKSRGGTSSLVFPNALSSSNGYPDSETRSVPAIYASDDEDADSFDDDDEEEGEDDENGIYISPAMPSPDVMAEDDPAVVNAALALIASEAAGANGQIHVVGVGVPPVPAVPFSAQTASSASASSSVAGMAAAKALQSTNPVHQIPTAPFIPTYPYSDADSIRALKHKHRRSHSRSHSVSKSRSGSGDKEEERDLEAGLSMVPPSPPPSPPPVAAMKMGTFDFDALPIPVSFLPPPPTAPAPVASSVASRPRAPESTLDTEVNVNGMALVDEKAPGMGLLLLPPGSPSSGYNLGLNSATGAGTGTECDPASPARSDDIAKLCEKRPGLVSESSSAASSSSPKWRTHHESRFHLPFFFRLPRLLSLFHPRHHSHPSSSSHSHSHSHSYNTFNDLSPYASYTRHESKSKCFSSPNPHASNPHHGSGGSRSWRTRCALESRVPAFGPVTRVLAPVVARAQWEIVVRAAVMAALLGCVVCGVVVALPVPGEV